MAAVQGHISLQNARISDAAQFHVVVPTDHCLGVTDQERYDPVTNPGGVRCTIQDAAINVFGPRRPSAWTPQEKAIGRGFAGAPTDNVGVQYGLGALRAGKITPAQFVDLNAKVGGLSLAGGAIVPNRLVADRPALANAYRSGMINEANNLDRTAIIDCRGPDPGAFHDAYRSWAIRARLEREQGHFKNHVIWFGQVPLMGDPGYESEAILAMDRWLAAVEADTSDGSRAEKIVADRPEDIQDRCSQIDGVEQVDVPGVGRVCELEQVQTRFGTPATVAGESVATDTNQCQMKPLRRADYYPIEFTDDQWAQLETAFPTGVCNWSLPGVSQQDTIPWQTYQDAAGDVIYGGRPLGAEPASEPIAAPKKAKRSRR